MIRRTVQIAGCVFLALNVLTSSAAPQDAGVAGLHQPGTGVRLPGDTEAGTEINSRTVQILLDIQNSKTPLDSPPKPTRPIDGLPRAPVAIPEAAVGSDRTPLSLKAKKDTIEPEARDPSQWTRPATNNPHATTENTRVQMLSDSNLGAVDVDVRGWLPTGVMRVVRQNREIVLLCSLFALGLAAFFTASASKKR